MHKPILSVDLLQSAGFVRVSAWILSEGRLALVTPLSPKPGVYAFAVEGRVVYVGLAASGLATRCKAYARPGRTQLTSTRLNATIVRTLSDGKVTVDMYAAQPNDMTWNGLPVSTLAGLEAGLIKAFDLPWNLRGV